MTHTIRKIASISLALVTVACFGFGFFEAPEIGAATDEIGVTQSVTEEISIDSPGDVTMSPSIPGMTGNPGSPATGEVTWNVKTANSAGFTMTLKASTDPALKLDASNEFSDYSPSDLGTPDYDWASPAAASAEFGFSVEPETSADADQKFLDNGADTCNTGSTDTADKCWLDFNGTSEITVINRSTETDGTGEDEVVKFRAESNAKHLSEGSYTATITATVSQN